MRSYQIAFGVVIGFLVASNVICAGFLCFSWVSAQATSLKHFVSNKRFCFAPLSAAKDTAQEKQHLINQLDGSSPHLSSSCSDRLALLHAEQHSVLLGAFI